MTHWRVAQQEQARRTAAPHRDTEPRVLLSDVRLEHGGSTIADQHQVVRRGTVLHVPAGSAMERAYGGPGNLGPMHSTSRDECADKSGLSN